MNHRQSSILVFAISSLFAAPAAFAQSSPAPERPYERNANQQERIENGLDSGQLNTHEAGRLERQESQVDNLESRSAADGRVTNNESRRIDHAQDRVGQNIAEQRHDEQTGNPESASSQRLQNDAQRDARQQKRIARGVKSGELKNREAGNLEAGQARSARGQASAASNGRVSAKEQKRLTRHEQRQSEKVRGKKHNRREELG